jgi:hypothetical protein
MARKDFKIYDKVSHVSNDKVKMTVQQVYEGEKRLDGVGAYILCSWISDDGKLNEIKFSQKELSNDTIKLEELMELHIKIKGS